VAEQWGRRWITIDTSRVSIAIARQRLMTATFDMYAFRDESVGVSGSFKFKTIPHVTLKSIARNTNLDPIFTKHQPLLDNTLELCNTALKQVGDATREKLRGKLLRKQKEEGRKAITDPDRRRWELPEKGKKWEQWQVPFDTDPDWPKALADAVTEYRKAWRTKMDEVNACITANAEQEELVDQPEVVKGILRVSGPFTVEGVRPEELSLGGDGFFGSTAGEIGAASSEGEDDSQNLRAYLSQMVGHLRTDGLTFLGNQHKKFARLDSLFEDSSASLIHAEGSWEGVGNTISNAVAISFGPQHGPVTAMQVEEAIRDAKQYDDLVVAGFSFDAEAFAVVREQNHPKLRIHLAHIRPDLNEAMSGLLKDTANSELFAVFGQPEIEIRESSKGWTCTLKGVDIYNPLDNTVRSSGADMVAAWFLDGDFDGRCFCITQAFFPNQDAWEKIAKALGSSADLEAFERLKGTCSLPFPKGKYGRIAVKVIDPRGNEVMAIRKLS
jgi:adenine-specific DNA-methyltransferase